MKVIATSKNIKPLNAGDKLLANIIGKPALQFKVRNKEDRRRKTTYTLQPEDPLYGMIEAYDKEAVPVCIKCCEPLKWDEHSICGNCI